MDNIKTFFVWTILHSRLNSFLNISVSNLCGAASFPIIHIPELYADLAHYHVLCQKENPVMKCKIAKIWSFDKTVKPDHSKL